MSTEDLVEKILSAVLEKGVGISKKNTCICYFWKPNKFPAETNKTSGFSIWNFSKKTCLGEQMPPVAFGKKWL